MSEPSALAELAGTIQTEREILTTGLAELTELFYGPNGYRYSVYLQTSDQEAEVSWTFFNSPQKTYDPPVTGARWNGYLDGRNDWIVLWWQRGYQEEAIAAQESVKAARESSTGLSSMTSEDLDALIELPGVLDQSVQALRSAREYFDEAKRSMNERKQRVINSDWQDDGAQAYRDSIDIQIQRVEWCSADADTLDQANVTLASAAVDVYDALAQIYIDELKEAGEMIKSVMSAPKDLANWTFYAKALADLMVGAVSRHAEDFQSKVRELGDMVDTERIVAKARNIARWEDWPSPTGEALTGEQAAS